MSSSRRQYPFHLIEPKWQQTWEEQQAFRAFNPGEEIPANHPFGVRHGLSGKVAATQLPAKYYILDMFPYPSGAGLHVGHPEGYTATDILARWRRACGFNVLHPMGWDSFGLPAEQYAVKTGQHPRVTTEANIANFTRQIKSLGFSYDWSRELATTDVEYFKWTQWIFLKLYNSWFNPETNKAEPIETLKYPAELCGDSLQVVGQASRLSSSSGENQHDGRDACPTTAARRAWRDSKRLAYVSEAPVNWCPELGTVLANEEVIDGKSEVGGFPVIRKPMRQWMLRITAYAEKLLADLDTIDWSDSLKEMQRNWIGRSEGAEVKFQVSSVQTENLKLNTENFITVFTTRPDTLFGATYMVLSPEHKLVSQITTVEQKQAVEDYKAFAAGKSDLERTELAKEKTGVFTGAYAINPVNGEKIPIWIADYVLASYGTGAIMAVPAHDERDWDFAKKFGLPIREVIRPTTLKSEKQQKTFRILGSEDGNSGNHDEVFAVFADESERQIPAPTEKAFTDCDDSCVCINSRFLTGLRAPEAKNCIIAWLEERGLGKKTINYKLRDWLFSRQRYWGEPFPIVWKKDAAGNLYHEAIPEKSLPILPPALEDYKPTSDGRPPLARATDWVQLKNGAERETNTMPQWAGSCWYYLRYLANTSSTRFTDKAAEQYWMGGERPAGNFQLRSPDEWSAEVDNLIHRAFADGKRPPHAVEFAPVSDELAMKIEEAAHLDVSGFRHSLDVFSVRHIFNNHGSSTLEAARGNVAVTPEDLKHLPEILAAPDAVEFSAKEPRGFKRLVIRKRVNGHVFIVEEVRGKNQQLQVVTLYKKTATARDVTTKAPLSNTSETLRHLGHNKPDSTPKVKATPGVDLYVGGTEHAVLHLLYARFWHKVLFDLGYVATAEPFYKLVNQGLILGEDGQKMSKSRGNVVNPDDVLVEYGADAFRLYEMFMGPLQDTKPWNTRGVEGVYRFLGRVWRLFVDEKSETAFEQAETLATEAQRHGELLDLILLNGEITDQSATPAQLKALHACIKKVTEDLDGMRFNTAISAMMVFINEAMTWQTRPLSVMKPFLQLLAPFAPHIAEELWARLHSAFGIRASSLAYAPWPKFDAALLVESEIEMPVSVNGKTRDVIKVSVDADNATIEAAAKASEKVQPFLAGKTIKKVIIVPKRMVNLIVA